MSALMAVAERLGRNDLVQVLALFLAALVFVLATRWPTAALPVNESWFVLAPVRLAALQLIALAFGAHASGERVADQRVTLLAVSVLALASAPFDVLTYAATYPSTPLAWSLAMPSVDTAAFFGLGIGLGRLATLARLRSLLPILVPSLLGAGIWLDLRLQATVFNPFSAAIRVVPAHAALMAALALLTFALLARQPASRMESAR